MDLKCSCFVPQATSLSLVPFGTVLQHAGKYIVCHQTVLGWLGEVIFIPFFIQGWVLDKIVREATPHMNVLRMLQCWHDTGLMVALTYFSQDKLFTRVTEGITEMMSAGLFLAGLTCNGNAYFLGLISFSWQREGFCNGLQFI